jgi:hypothetical protein
VPETYLITKAGVCDFAELCFMATDNNLVENLISHKQHFTTQNCKLGSNISLDIGLVNFHEGHVYFVLLK